MTKSWQMQPIWRAPCERQRTSCRVKPGRHANGHWESFDTLAAALKEYLLQQQQEQPGAGARGLAKPGVQSTQAASAAAMYSKQLLLYLQKPHITTSLQSALAQLDQSQLHGWQHRHLS